MNVDGGEDPQQRTLVVHLHPGRHVNERFDCIVERIGSTFAEADPSLLNLRKGEIEAIGPVAGGTEEIERLN
jgi:hypothetical protein